MNDLQPPTGDRSSGDTEGRELLGPLQAPVTAGLAARCILICALFEIPLAALSATFPESPEEVNVALLVTSILANMLMQAALVLAIGWHDLRQPTSLAWIFTSLAKRSLSLLGTFLATFAIILVGCVVPSLVLIGVANVGILGLFLAPLVFYLALRVQASVSFAMPACMLESLSPVKAVDSSFRRSRECRGRLMMVAFLQGVVTAGMGRFAVSDVGSLGARQWVPAIVSVFLTPVFAGWVVRIYFEVRVIHEGFRNADLRTELERLVSRLSRGKL